MQRRSPHSATRLAALLEAGPDAGLDAGLEAELRVGDQLVVLLVAQPPSAKEAGGRGRARARTAVGLAQRRREAGRRLGPLLGGGVWVRVRARRTQGIGLGLVDPSP